MRFFEFLYYRSSIFLTALSLWSGFWLSDQIKVLTNWPTKFQLVFEYLLNFATPIPYFLFIVGVEVWGYLKERTERQNLTKLQTEASRVPQLKSEIRVEKQAHAESKSSYSETLKSALRLMLCSETIRFDHRCRVTIYRRQAATDDELRQIFRFSENQNYKLGGRYRIPIGEGVVGAAWGNHGVKHVALEADPETAEFRTEMEEHLKADRCSTPNCELSMPSKEFYAQGLDDHETGHRVGIVVYECTEAGVLDIERIDNILGAQALDLARFVKHLGRLDQEFAPNMGGV